ncbi:hypothetical protein PR048_014900 [Dryococelus australis]|uniref:Uncharacterized protein n=1 Tax=Dryococelus australis TaxID=614101 RepID=A0ABQ9HFG8_9NEOP|nr:hypothetical protein PR048_014900 [Dryococelus australis]
MEKFSNAISNANSWLNTSGWLIQKLTVVYTVHQNCRIFKQHQSTTYHKNTVLAQADVEKRKESIDMQLDDRRMKDIIQLFGLQNIPPRGHTDFGRISLSMPVDNDGNFRSLLRYLTNGKDQAL